MEVIGSPSGVTPTISDPAARPLPNGDVDIVGADDEALDGPRNRSQSAAEASTDPGNLDHLKELMGQWQAHRTTSPPTKRMAGPQ